MPEDVSQNRIFQLDDHIANLIAAGEVVERPASVVKELVENSIDAGADNITVYLEDGGKELIKVVDNGCGMTRDDAVTCLQRHATSKISSAEDLEAIATLGFRGEALPSIASVSYFNLTTKTEWTHEGTELIVEGGTITDLRMVGAPQGTTISVARIFFNTPARLKFLKSSQTELSHISDIIGQFAIAYPHISFKLIHNDRDVLTSPGTKQRINSIVQVLGKDTAKSLVPISYSQGLVAVEGFIGNPTLTRNHRRDQVFFVNGRPVRSRTITHALDMAYRGLLQPARFPVAVVLINIAPELVDVNVHPTKAEVKFSSEHEIHSAVHRAANQALMAGAAAPTIGAVDQPPVQILSNQPGNAYPTQQRLEIPDEESLKQFSEALAQRRAQVINTEPGPDPFVWGQGTGVPMEESPVTEANFDTARTVALTGVRVIGQAKNMYIVAVCDDGILILDQHVAHERVIYDSLVKRSSDQSADIQGMLLPATISFSARESAILGQRLDDVRKIGYDLEEFGQNTYLLRGSPAGLKPEVAESVLKEIVTELLETSIAKHLVVRRDQVLITASCKMAVKAGEPMAMPEMSKLVEDLLKCENPFVCPHGRPIVVSLSNWELARKFHRA